MHNDVNIQFLSFYCVVNVDISDISHFLQHIFYKKSLFPPTGDMAGSYVKGCAIHNSFNRAVNIHDTHNVLVEHNVAYDIMGGAFFLEDGIETGMLPLTLLPRDKSFI